MTFNFLMIRGDQDEKNRNNFIINTSTERDSRLGW
jgi:hypothetical protein